MINVFQHFFTANDGEVIFEVSLITAASSDNALSRRTGADGSEVLMQEGDNSPGLALKVLCVASV